MLMIGLSGISYKFDPATQGVAFNKDISKHWGVGYGVEVTHVPAQLGVPGQQDQKEVTQTLEGEYRVSDKVTMGAQKEIRPSAATMGGTVYREIPDDRVFIKYHTKF